MARIIVDLTPLYNRKITGLEIYGIAFYEALKKTKHTIIPIFSTINTLDDNPHSVIINSDKRFIVENFHLPSIIKSIKADIAFFPIFPPPINCYNESTKIIPTIHDLAFRYYSNTLSWKARIYLKPKYEIALKKSDYIITISESVKKELNKVTSKPILNWGNEISKDYCLGNYTFDTSILRRLNISENKYFISVSTIEPRKNMRYLFELWDEFIKYYPDFKLVLTGRKGWGNDKELNQAFKKIQNNVIFTGYVEQDDLINLYHFSKAFILLSLYEGFGRTPIEALACGTNIIVSDIPIFRENLSENNATFLSLTNKEQSIFTLLNSVKTCVSRRKDVSDYFNVIERNILRQLDSLIK